MKELRVYICCNQLPRTNESLKIILDSISNSSLKHHKIVLCHSYDWNPDYDFGNLNVTLYNTLVDFSSFEFYALKKMWEDAQQEDFYALYLHCKGASKIDDASFLNSCAWLEYMLDATVTNSPTCISHLNSGADLVGAMWFWHFKGNFFWCNSQYIKHLPNPIDLGITNRYACEYWCSHAFWHNECSLPSIKNLYYIPNMPADDGFIDLKSNGFLPDYSRKHVLSSFLEFVNCGNFSSFDVIEVDDQTFVNNIGLFIKYLNYDGLVLNTDSLKFYDVHELRSIMNAM